MKILVSGSHGLVGSALCAAFAAEGHQLVRLVRPRPGGTPDSARAATPPGDTTPWDPDHGPLEPSHLEGADALVHLAGENLASARWSAAVKTRIRDSRVRGTRLLCEALVRLARPPRVLVSGSAIGYYGDRGGEVLREESRGGHGFLADVARAWEEACAPARAAGVRVVHPRTAMVLSARGGALAELLRPFRLGLGGPMGGGRQFWSWIALDDLVALIAHALARDDLAGPVNAAAGATRQRDFARTLGRVLHRPAIAPAPGLALRALLGEMADEMLLASQRAEPAKALASGFHFRHEALEDALRHALAAEPAA